MIRISRIKMSNILSIPSRTDLKDVLPISILVGPNNSGKSNFIRSMKFYHELSKYSKTQDYASDSIKEMQHRLAPDDYISIEIRFHYENESQSKHPLEIVHFVTYDKQGRFEREWLRFKNKHNDRMIRIFTKGKNGNAYSASLQNSKSVDAFLSGTDTDITETLEEMTLGSYKPFLWSAQSNNRGLLIFEEIEKFISNWIFIPANRALGSDGESDSLKSDGRNTEQLSKQLRRQRQRTNKLLTYVFRLTGIIDLNIDNDPNDNTKPLTLVSDMPDEEVKLRYFGSGFEQMLILLTHILLPQVYKEYTDNTIFFIEEPEIHLHPLFQRKLLQFLIERSKTNQFFSTTHSTIFCRQKRQILQPYLVNKREHRTQIRVIGEEEMQEIKSILAHMNTDLFAYNAVLFVEGETEGTILPLLARNLGIDIVDDGIRILNSKGYGNMRQLENIIDLLDKSGIEIYALFDNHKGDQRRLTDIKNRLEKNNFFELPEEFENCFSAVVLTEAISNLCSDFNCPLSIDERNSVRQELESTDKSKINVLTKYFHEKTKGSLSKVHFGEAVATAVKKCDEVGNTPPEHLLKLISKNIKHELEISRNEIS